MQLPKEEKAAEEGKKPAAGNRWLIPFITFLLVILTIFIVVYAVPKWFVKQPPPESASKHILYSKGDVIPVAISKEAYDKYKQLFAARHYVEVQQMMTEGSILTLPSGTLIDIVNQGSFDSEVKLLYGTKTGTVVWVSTEWIRKK